MLTATSWGTSIRLRVRGLPLNQPCRLIVRSRAGKTEVTGFWDAWRDGPVSVPASAAWRPSNIFRCTGSCLSFWFPVTVGSASVPRRTSGIGGVLGTVRRPDDGKIQLTYNGRPLYTFRLDTSPGQDHGNGFSDSFGGTSFTWHAVTTSGAAGNAGQGGGTSSGGSYQGSGSGY